MARHWRSAPRIDYTRSKWAALEPLSTAPLTAAEVCRKRLELAEEMLELVLEDGQDLAGPQRRMLCRVSEALVALRRQASG